MNRLLSLSLSAGLALALSACRDSGGSGGGVSNQDMSHANNPGDMASKPGDDLLMVGDEDMAGPAQTTTLHDINVGNVGNKSPVTVSGLVVTGVATNAGHSKSGKKYCHYVAFVQDPNGMAPSGMKLYASGNPCTPLDGGSCHCPYPPMSNTPLDAIATLGDVFTVSGTVSLYAPTTDAGLAPQTHELDVTKGTLTMTGSGGTVTPYVPGTASDFAVNGSGYQNYESMLVTIQGPAAAGAHDNYGGFDFAGAHFSGSDYDFIWGMKGAFPAANMTLKSITGVADADYGGGIAPRTKADFAM